MFDSDGLARKDHTEVDLLPVEADATASRDGGGFVVEGIVEVWQPPIYLRGDGR